MEIDSSFRPNPERGVYIEGEVNNRMVAALTPQIMGLWADPSKPITLYINSNGGIIHSARMIEGMLKAKGMDGEVRRIIGVGVGFALSAAADLLITSDYAIAYPSCQIHCHGSRYTTQEPVTLETAVRYAEDLREGNDDRALRLAQSVFPRVLFRYQYLKSDFETIRKTYPKASTDAECFVFAIADNVSEHAANLAFRVMARLTQMTELSNYACSKLPTIAKVGMARYEATMLRRIIAFTLKSHAKDKGWWLSPPNGGIDEVVRSFKLLHDYHFGKHWDTLETLIVHYRRFFISEEKEREIRTKASNAAEAERDINDAVQESMEPIWYYTLFLCRALMERENPLSSTDAFWLGLIDEVAGEDLPSLRKAMETPPDETMEIEFSPKN